MELHRCTRASTRDGYCTRHHPDYVSPSQAKAMAAHDAEVAMSPRDKLLLRITCLKGQHEMALQMVTDAQVQARTVYKDLRKAEDALQRFDYPFLEMQKATLA
jgi:hypothetical protein